MNLKLTRPIVFFDLETTGLNTKVDRIIEICVIKLHPDGQKEIKTKRVNPTIPISKESSEITGISDEDVKDCPTFTQFAKGIKTFMEGCDISGYNILRFDIPVLVEEFKRAEVEFSMKDIEVIDVQRIYHKMEPRTLEAAMRFYCNEELSGAHAAENDVEGTIKVLEGQLAKYEELDKDVASIAAFCKDDRWVDTAGRLHWKDGEVSVGFGKKQGELLKDLVKKDKGYLDWILRGEFPEDTKDIIRNAFKGVFPTKEK
ncbi:MAG: 3'-5' exonuclease [Lentisphaeraceae bacterium]|nr:3'-5' exonuclease [Lentisphaeraceae bacterium]